MNFNDASVPDKGNSIEFIWNNGEGKLKAYFDAKELGIKVSGTAYIDITDIAIDLAFVLG